MDLSLTFVTAQWPLYRPSPGMISRDLLKRRAASAASPTLYSGSCTVVTLATPIEPTPSPFTPFPLFVVNIIDFSKEFCVCFDCWLQACVLRPAGRLALSRSSSHWSSMIRAPSRALSYEMPNLAIMLGEVV